jgi:hypothetical protein
MKFVCLFVCAKEWIGKQNYLVRDVKYCVSKINTFYLKYILIQCLTKYSGRIIYPPTANLQP